MLSFMILSFVKIRFIRFVGVELFLASNSNHLFGINKIMCSKMTEEIVRRIVQKKREAERERERNRPIDKRTTTITTIIKISDFDLRS